MDDKERKKKTREALKKNGLCAVCGKEKVDEGKLICSSCHERQLTYAERRRVERKRRAAQGLCTTCGVRKAEPRRRTCSDCFQKGKEHRMNKGGTSTPVKECDQKQSKKAAKEDGTLCWKCTNYFCSWRLDFTPVNGWEATPTKAVRVHDAKGDVKDVQRYQVASCPQFTEKRRRF